MKYRFLLLSLLAFFGSKAQQINPVPDYVFANRMSVGRNAVTDTAAYFSIGPRYGALRGFMPPMVTDTASVTGTKRNGLLIFSIQKNKFLYWDSVRVQWSDMAGSSGSYITGTLTNRYIPKATSSTTLGNSVMYDSSSHVRVYANWLGSGNSNRYLFQTEVDGQNGYGLKVQQNDSNDNNLQWVMSMRHGLLTTAKPRPEFGVGHDMQLPDDAGTFRRVGSILTRLTDTTAAGISAKMQFGVAKSGSLVTPLQIYSDSSIRMAKLAGSGSRYVVADANGDLTASASLASVDTFSISTRAWRQKGIDSVASVRVGGSGTTNYIPKFTASSTLGNSVAYDNGGTELLVNTTTDAGAYALQVAGSIYNTTGAVLAASSGNVGIGTTSPASTLHIAKAGNDLITLERTNKSTGSGKFGINVESNSQTTISYDNASPLVIGTATNPSDGTGFTERMRITSAGELLIGTTSDAGAYVLQASGSIYNTTSAVFAASSGTVGIGTSSGGALLHMYSAATGGTELRLDNGNADAGNRNWSLKLNAFNYGDLGFLVSASNGGDPESGSLKMTLASDGELFLGNRNDAGNYLLQVYGNIYNTGSLTTGAPSSGSAKPWKLGEAATVSPTSPNRTIRVEIDGTVYYIHAKTTND